MAEFIDQIKIYGLRT